MSRRPAYLRFGGKRNYCIGKDFYSQHGGGGSDAII
jgi:hypothetical protein